MITPNYLKNGDTIGIVCPSGYMPINKIEVCINTLQHWGYKVKLGSTVGNQYHYFSGTDEERLLDVQQMLDDTEVKAILFGRGGYGLSRIINYINFYSFIKNPKWLVGFSDITILHAHLHSQLKISSLHASMAAAFMDEGYKNQFVQSIKQILAGEKVDYSCGFHKYNKTGIAKGELIGGNLTLIAHLIGSTSSYVHTKGKILFLEDVGEYLYNIDRLLIQLKNNGLLKDLSGVIIGGFTDMKDTFIPFGEDVYTIIYNQFKAYNYPICFSFPVGHQTNNYALKIGCKYQLTVSEEGTSLIELI